MDPAQLAALQAQAAQSGGASGGDPKDMEKEKAEAEARESMKRDLLATVLSPEARERLSRIALVAPARSTQIEGILLRMAQSGQLKGRVSEQQLIDLLQQAEESQNKTAPKKGGIVYQRRKDLDDDDWDI